MGCLTPGPKMKKTQRVIVAFSNGETDARRLLQFLRLNCSCFLIRNDCRSRAMVSRHRACGKQKWGHFNGVY
jgi:hypothetical protein